MTATVIMGAIASGIITQVSQLPIEIQPYAISLASTLGVIAAIMTSLWATLINRTKDIIAGLNLPTKVEAIQPVEKTSTIVTIPPEAINK